MRIVLGLFSIGIIFLGMWLIATSGANPTPETIPATQVVSAPGQTKASPVILGTALLVGGVLFLLMVFRRK
jgi:hypothetical protein